MDQSTPPKKKGIPGWAIALIIGGGCFMVIPVIAIIAAIAIPGLLASQRASNERNASASLMTLASAEADFRANDRDGNRFMDYWTGDVSQLYCLTPTDSPGKNPIKLIDLSIAAGDSFPMEGDLAVSVAVGSGPATTTDINSLAQQGPKAGYWYEALTADNGSPDTPVYRTIVDDSKSATKNTSRFGFAAWPDALGSSGLWVFIISEQNTMYKRQPNHQDVIPTNPLMIPPGPIQMEAYANWPTEEQLATEWARMD